jgi:hypothetical protein
LAEFMDNFDRLYPGERRDYRVEIKVQRAKFKE